MTETPAGPPDGADPSMEDILASIRRILNEEEAPAAEDPPPVKAPVEAPAEDDVLVLEPSMMVPVSDPEPEVTAPEPEPEPEAPVARIEPPRRKIEGAMPSYPPVHSPAYPLADPPEMPGMPPPVPDLVAPAAAAAAASSVSNLVRTLTAGRSTQVYSGGPTLEDIVRAELRPLLKEWLDAYLPPLVERLVRTEIERVVGRAVP